MGQLVLTVSIPSTRRIPNLVARFAVDRLSLCLINRLASTEIIRKLGNMSNEQGELFKLNRTSMSIDPDVTFEQWDEIGGRVRGIVDSSRWWRADWGHQGDVRFGEMAYQSSHMQLSRQYKWTAEKFSPARRREDLTYSHHREVAALEPDIQDKLLDMAAANNWTVQTLVAAVKETKAVGHASPPAPESREFTEPPKEDQTAPRTSTKPSTPAAAAEPRPSPDPSDRPALRVVGGTGVPTHDELLFAVVAAAREAVFFGEITDTLRLAVQALDSHEEPLRAVV